jgi:hypothetical protein
METAPSSAAERRAKAEGNSGCSEAEVLWCETKESSPQSEGAPAIRSIATGRGHEVDERRRTVRCHAVCAVGNTSEPHGIYFSDALGRAGPLRATRGGTPSVKSTGGGSAKGGGHSRPLKHVELSTRPPRNYRRRFHFLLSQISSVDLRSTDVTFFT